MDKEVKEEAREEAKKCGLENIDEKTLIKLALEVGQYYRDTGYRTVLTRDRLNKIEIGMTKAQALEVMGTPDRREAQDNREWLLYCTYKEFFTPLLLEDGKLIGWGRHFWAPEEHKCDIKIDQTVEQKNSKQGGKENE